MILRIDNKVISEAEKLFLIWQASYKIEAEILQATNFPPLSRTVQNFIESTTYFYSYNEEQSLAAVIELDKRDKSIHIQSLVVSPNHFRKGIASILLKYVLEENEKADFTVETGVDNIPAINLYLKSGFIEDMQYDTDHGVRKIKLFLKR